MRTVAGAALVPLVVCALLLRERRGLSGDVEAWKRYRARWMVNFCSEVPSEAVAERCGVVGTPERDDGKDLAALCGASRGAAAGALATECLHAVSLGFTGGDIGPVGSSGHSGDIPPTVMLGHRRRRRNNQLVLPPGGGLEEAACRCAARLAGGPEEGGPAGCAGAPAFLNVVVVHNPKDAAEFHGVCTMDQLSEWIATAILPAFGRPLRVLHADLPDGRDVSGLPVLNNSLVVAHANGKDRRHAAVGLYGLMARARGVRNMGLLHLGHEVFSVSYLDAYGAFDYVLRQQYSSEYARSSTYVPVGPMSRFLPRRHRREPPTASARSTFCAAMVGKQAKQASLAGQPDRQEMLAMLRRSPGVCDMPSVGGEDYEAQLFDTVFSLCPQGRVAETSRLWESVVAGAIVVTTHAPFIEHELQAPPFIVLDRWSSLAEELERFRGRPDRVDELQRRQQAWFSEYKRHLGVRIRGLADRGFRPGAS